MPRMRILSSAEQDTFDRPPVFDHQDRKRFFDLSRALIDKARGLRTPVSQIGFLLMCGYFKAAKRFYGPQEFHKADVEAAARLLGLQGADFTPETYAKQSRARHQRLVLQFYGFTPFNRKAEKALVPEIATMARIHLKPRLIFDRCIDFLMQRRVQVPRSGVLLELIRSGLQAHKAELIAQMDACLTDDARALLNDLFTTRTIRTAIA